MATEIENPLHRLSDEQIEAIGKEFDQLHEEVFDDLGDRDARYIRSMIDLHRRLALLGRVLLVGSRYKPLWAAGTATLSLAKILENMEIGHNVMHGQWDWMNDPVINSAAWDWDSASTPEAWKHSHNYVHHTYTNIRGKDKDLGYEIMRIDPHQKWHPVYLAQPFYNLVLAALFEWGVAFHDLDFDAIRAGEKSKEEVRRQVKGMAAKARSQIVKDYIAFPALSALLMAIPDARTRAKDEGRWDKVKRHPTLGDNVVVGSGAKILGPFTVGSGAKIGSNSVVVKEVPENATVVGIPGRMVMAQKKEEGRADLEHGNLPDPEAKAIACLFDQIRELERKYAALAEEHAELKKTFETSRRDVSS